MKTVQLMNALSNVAAGNVSNAVDLLNAFKNHVNAQSGKKISEDQADQLLEYADGALAALVVEAAGASAMTARRPPLERFTEDTDPVSNQGLSVRSFQIAGRDKSVSGH
jgi:hypothetical protein